MEAKLKNVEMIVGSSKKLPDIAIIAGIEFKVNKHCLEMLQCHENSENLYTGVERACMAYALFELVKEKMVGSPLEISKTRVSTIRSNALNGKFMISWNTQGSFSMLRKTVGVFLSCLAPHKLYSKYAENCKLMGCKADRSVFNKLANEMSTAINKGIKIAACGKIKITLPKLKDLLSKVVGKCPKQEQVKDVSEPPKHSDFSTDTPFVKASGIDAIAVADYISAKSGGMAVCVCDNKVYVYNKSWETKRNALKKANRINDYVRQKYTALKDEFPCVFAYMAITRNYTDCCASTKIIKTKPTALSIGALLKKSMS
jgi:hypothetical protein